MNENNILSLDDIYFKDAFTKVDDKINIEANNLTVECISSKQNKFSLDSDGNLTVNSITSMQGTNLNLLDVYPVGSIYLSTMNTDPATLFGGVWTPFGEGRCLVGVDTNQTEFNTVELTGGSKYLQSHTHTMDLAGNHTHNGKIKQTDGHYSGSSNEARKYDETGGLEVQLTNLAGNHTHIVHATGAGDSGNLPPYITVYMYKRVS